MKRGKRTKGEKVERGAPRSPFKPFALPASSPSPPESGGWTLIELVITMTVLSVLTMAVVPIVRNNVRRQREQRLREVLREMRQAIDEFRRDTVAMQCGPIAGGPPVTSGNAPPIPGQVQYIDPRSRVMLADCTIFGVDNPDRYPPDLQTLADGVDVVPRPGAGAGAIPGVGLGQGTGRATDTGSLVPKKKYYLREIPVDPITGERDWCVRSSYDPPDADCSAAPVNVFDVRSKAPGKALNGENYSDW